MIHLQNLLVFVLHFVTQLFIYALIIRFLLRAGNINSPHPIIYAIAKITNPITAIFNEVLRLKYRWDWSALLSAVLIKTIYNFVALGLLHKNGIDLGVLNYFLLATIDVLQSLLRIGFWLIIISVLLSWFVRDFNQAIEIIYKLANFFLQPVRRFNTVIGGIDFSPMIVIFCIAAIEISVLPPLYNLALTL